MLLMGFPTSSEASGPLVLAFYYAWYDLTTWSSGQLVDLPAQQYVSADAGTIGRHVSQAQSAGIDAFVQSWYGPASGNQTEGNFQMLLDTAAAVGFRAAVDFEVGSPYFASAADRIAALQHLLSGHANHPAYLRVDGKPVVFFWASWLLSVEEWAAIRDEVDPAHATIWLAEGAYTDYLSVFDGLHLYNIAWSDNPAGTLGYWGEQVRSRAAVLGTYKYWAATVMPGWNDTLIAGKTDTFVRDRAGGAYYQLCWSGAIGRGPDMVIVTSFNEWLEGSMIEPSQSYGDFYLRLTGELASAYKAGINPVPAPLPTAAPVATPLSDDSAAATALATSPPRSSDRVLVPSTPAALPDGSIVHVVQPGDTLWGIGQRYSVTLDRLLELNRLEEDTLLAIGQRLVVALPTSSPTPAARPESPRPTATRTVMAAEGDESWADSTPAATTVASVAPESEIVPDPSATLTQTPTELPPTVKASVDRSEPMGEFRIVLWAGGALVIFGGGIWILRRKRLGQ